MATFYPVFASIGGDRRTADAYRRLEEGQHASPQPYVPPALSEATKRFMKIAMMSCCTIMGTTMLVSLFVSRFVYQDPELQDPFMMIAQCVIALVIMRLGYVLILADRQ